MLIFLDYRMCRQEAKGIRLIVKKISNILFPDKDLIGLRTRLEDMTFGGGGGITIPPFSQKDMEHLRIPLHEILLATNNLSENNIIAVGGFGKVYQGLSEQHGTIAVKQLDHVAKGLKYLHEDVGAQHRILHRDVKSSNILLDENWKAKISDFGLSKIALANVSCSVIITRVCGTLGYVDPQYREHNILTQKSDVYSFGVVLFEVLCSRLVNAREYHFSAESAQNHYEKDTLDEIIDSGLRSQMNSDCLSIYSTIAYQCLKKQRDERPTMGLVVDQLEKALDYQQVSCAMVTTFIRHLFFRLLMLIFDIKVNMFNLKKK
ncbi:putative protein kinase RLK-Pelle-CrRLK1L-1 family [Helianthus anomalus]